MCARFQVWGHTNIATYRLNLTDSTITRHKEDTSQLLSVPYALHSGSSNASLLLFGEDYLSYSGNELTLKKVDLSTNVSGTLPLTSGGTGATSAPMIGVITAADAAAARTALGVGTLAVQNVGAVDIDGGAIDATAIGATTASTGAFTTLAGSGAVDFNSTLTVADNLSLDGDNKELRFHEGANYVGFKAPALTADQIWVLPTADGSVNQILKTSSVQYSSGITLSSFYTLSYACHTLILI